MGGKPEQHQTLPEMIAILCLIQPESAIKHLPVKNRKEPPLKEINEKNENYMDFGRLENLLSLCNFGSVL